MTSTKLFQSKEIPFTSVQLTAGLFRERVSVHHKTLLPTAMKQCVDTGRIANFRNAGLKLAGQAHRPFEGIYFNDSDVYKVLEGVAYSLQQIPEPAVEAVADEWIALVAAAQESDGYLNTYFTLSSPDKKWTDMEKHEDYCAGHLFEAAVAYFRATGKELLLTVARRLADHMVARFLRGGQSWVVGHQGPELALVKLYQLTGVIEYLELGRWMVEQRGKGLGRGTIWEKPEWGPRYCQDDLPARELSEVTGHAVRAMYYYTGIADLASQTKDESFLPALDRLWDSVTGRNLYLTGGIGSSRHNEGFAGDFVLPNDQAYCETCASIGLVYWAQRMHLLSGDARYVDVLERVLYNGVLSGLSRSGDHFFYVNPLSSSGHHHREVWFDCSCCPTSLARFIPSLSGYFYSQDPLGLTVNLYGASTLNTVWQDQPFVLTQSTDYPWSGAVSLTIQRASGREMELRLRIPGWAASYTLQVNGEPVEAAVEQGYLVVSRGWSPGDKVRLDLDLPVDRIAADERVAANRGRVALQRGPVVFCAEGADNPGIEASLSDEAAIRVDQHPELGGPCLVAREHDGSSLVFVPYFLWDNRAPGPMDVWVTRKPRSLKALYGRASGLGLFP